MVKEGVVETILDRDELWVDSILDRDELWMGGLIWIAFKRSSTREAYLYLVQWSFDLARPAWGSRQPARGLHFHHVVQDATHCLREGDR